MHFFMDLFCHDYQYWISHFLLWKQLWKLMLSDRISIQAKLVYSTSWTFHIAKSAWEVLYGSSFLTLTYCFFSESVSHVRKQYMLNIRKRKLQSDILLLSRKSHESHPEKLPLHCTGVAKFSFEQVGFISCCLDGYCEKKDTSETLKVEITCLALYFYPSSVERDKCALHRADTCSGNWLPF